MALNVSRLVRAQVNLSPLAAVRRGFGTLLIAGDTPVIDGIERLRSYVDLDSVAQDFGTTAPEYEAAALYFSQVPKPQQLMIGRWIAEPSSAILRGSILTPAEQDMSVWTNIIDGSFAITIDGTVQTVTGLNFAGETNLNGVAATIDAALNTGSVVWDGTRFIITSASTGAASTISYATTAGIGTDISAKMKLTNTTASGIVPGFDAERPVDGVVALANSSGNWYGLMFATTATISDDDLLGVSEFVEAAEPSRVFGITTTNTIVLDSTATTDIASRAKALQYRRTAVVYSQNRLAMASFFGRAFSVNFNANRSVITLMYKTMPGVVAENITESQAQTLKFKNCNVYAAYNNDTAIIQYGTVASGAYFDEVHGLDWLADAVQTAVYNLLYTSMTKIPQTDFGQNMLVGVISGVMNEGINNGLIAPGTWNADGFGQLSRGDYLTEGFYIYAAPMATQDQSIREQRIAPPIQVAVKLAGAIHEVDAIINVNR